MRESAIFSVAIRRLGEGVDIANEVGFQELNGFFEVIHLLLVLFFFAHELLFEAMVACFGGNDKSVNDGPVAGCVKGVSGNGAANGSRGEPSEGNELVDSDRVLSGVY